MQLFPGDNDKENLLVCSTLKRWQYSTIVVLKYCSFDELYVQVSKRKAVYPVSSSPAVLGAEACAQSF
jgi:hypothetical protein